jgi:hypothetical protein
MFDEPERASGENRHHLIDAIPEEEAAIEGGDTRFANR